MSRVVIDASRYRYQKELVDAFRAFGVEVVLDTKAAELAAPSRFEGIVRHAPWAAKDGPLGPRHFQSAASANVIEHIARFAVEHEFTAVLAPSHFLSNSERHKWFELDQKSCEALRKAIDREGGRNIGIDYPLLIPHTLLFDEGVRGEIVAGLADLPFDNLWVRTSGFGADGAPLTTVRYIQTLRSLHNLGKPIIADHLGGLIGLATIAFGAACGIAHGIGERERFDARSWNRPRQSRESPTRNGPTRRVLIAELDKSFTARELQFLVEAKGARRLVVCGDRSCCPHGLPDMLDNPKRHAINRRILQIDGLQKVPNGNREQHYMRTEVSKAVCLARQVKELQVGDEMKTRLAEHSRRMERLQKALEHLFEMRGRGVPRSPTAVRRVGLDRGIRGGEW